MKAEQIWFEMMFVNEIRSQLAGILWRHTFEGQIWNVFEQPPRF